MSEESPQPSDQSPLTTSEMHEDSYQMPEESPPTTNEMHEDTYQMPEESPPTTSEMHEDSYQMPEESPPTTSEMHEDTAELPAPAPVVEESQEPSFNDGQVSNTEIPRQPTGAIISDEAVIVSNPNAPDLEAIEIPLSGGEVVETVAEVRQPEPIKDPSDGIDPLNGLVAGAALVAGGIVAKMAKNKHDASK